MRKIYRFLCSTDGATSIEYAFLASLIAIVIITAITAVGTSVTGVFNNVATAVK
jgi:pilus assembly protein Flp/PilA